MDTMETNGPSWPSGDTVTSFVPTVSVTLDPQSASGYLQLSEDWKCVTYSGLYHSVYLHPQQFDCEPGVLGNKGFTWGKVYWEVEVEREDWFEDEEEGDEEEEGDQIMSGDDCAITEKMEAE